MAYDDKILGPLFPTRTGWATGAASERHMLDAVGGAGDFRTRLQQNSDGSTTMLRTRGGQPEFTTTRTRTAGGSETPTVSLTCNLFLNAGIVDLHGAGISDPNIAAEGTIYQTNFVAALGAIPAVGAGNVKTRYTSDGKEVFSPLDTLPADATTAQCFSMAAGDYQTKKNVAWQVPASIFTGRTRLYVQSLYGGIRKDILLSKGDFVRPQLGITTQALADADIPPILIGTGSGVFYDKTDNTHWLILPGESSALILSLRGTFCSERLRVKLASDKLTIDEKDRLEAYVLSNSTPYLQGESQEVFYDPTPSEGLGYSWHWNFDGDTCDLVQVIEKYVRPGVWGFKSTHFRLQFSRAPDGVFSVARTIVSGPNEWSVPKNINVVAYPDWGAGRLIKAGNLPSGITDESQNGELYAFYKKNELQVVRFIGPSSTAPPSRSNSSPYFGGQFYSSVVRGYTLEQSDGSSIGTSEWVANATEFTCGPVTVGGLNGSKTKDEYIATYGGRAFESTVFTERYFTTYTGTIGFPVLSYHYDVDGNVVMDGGVYEEHTITAPQIDAEFQVIKTTWSKLQKNYTESEQSFTLVVIPHGDAEAAYLYGNRMTHKVGTENGLDLYWTTFSRSYHWTLNGALFERFTLGDVFGGLGLSSEDGTDYSNPIDTTNVSGQGCSLISNSGVFSATPVDVSPFFSTLDYVEQSWGTTSSVNGVVRSPENNIESGSPVFPIYSSLVGWA